MYERVNVGDAPAVWLRRRASVTVPTVAPSCSAVLRASSPLIVDRARASGGRSPACSARRNVAMTDHDDATVVDASRRGRTDEPDVESVVDTP
jgi:hypothetical protein